jgi:hypothetical protein
VSGQYDQLYTNGVESKLLLYMFYKMILSNNPQFGYISYHSEQKIKMHIYFDYSQFVQDFCYGLSHFEDKGLRT